MSTSVKAPGSPFKGLAAFEDSELDALFFFGRERECEVIVANLLAARLTVLYGESGVGKSSLLGAGVVRGVRTVAPEATVSFHSRWSGSTSGLVDAVRDADEGYLVLDQFEEYFLYHGDDDSPGTLLHDLPALLQDSRVNVLISLREDTLARLDAFKARIPSVFANQVRLEHLSREAARAAIVKPLDRWNELFGEYVSIEPALVEAVLDEVAAGRVEGRAHDRDRIEAPYLQLVLERIWHTERAAGSTVLRLETLRALGGAATIVRDHLLGALAGLDPEEQDVAAEVFEHLVTPSGTKIAHRAPDLAQYARVPEDVLRRVLGALTRDRIVHSVDGSDRYEIFHDVLAEPIQGWRQERRLVRERLAARRRQRRLIAVAAVSLAALAAVAALAAWALSERSSARSQTRHAHARELEARALLQLTTDPNGSVRLALSAARLEPNVAAESVLRTALIADRLRFVVHAPGQINSVATSPDGSRIAAATTRGRFMVIDARTGKVVQRLRAEGAVVTVAFRPDGSLVTADANGLAASWDPATGRRLAPETRIVAARGPTTAPVVFTPHGRLERLLPHIRKISASPRADLVAAAVADKEGHVRADVFDRRGRLLRVLPGIGVSDLEFTHDGKQVVVASADGLTTLWEPRQGKRVRVFADSDKGGKKKRPSVESVAFSPDGKLLATGVADSGVRIWTVATGERTFFLFGHTNPVAMVAWSPDGRLVASGSFDRNAILWRVHDIVGAGSMAATLAGDAEAVRTLAFTPDSTRLVTGSDDGTVRAWVASADPQLRALGRAAAPYIGARWVKSTIVAASTDGVVQVFDARTRRQVHVLRAGGAATSFAVAADGSLVALGGATGATTVWEVGSGRKLDEVSGSSGVLAVALSADGRLAASGDRRGVVRVWDARTGRARWTKVQDGEVTDLAFSPAGDELVTASPAGATVWAAPNGGIVHRLPVPGGIVRILYSPAGRLIGAADVDGTARLWFAKTGNLYRVLRGHRAQLTDITFSPDGQLLATASHDADGRVWNVDTGRPVHVLRGHFGTVAAIAFSPDRRWLATAGPISAGVWPMSTGRLFFYLRGDTALLTSVGFSPDGRTILSASLDRTVRTYTCDVCVSRAALMLLAERRLAHRG